MNRLMILTVSLLSVCAAENLASRLEVSGRIINGRNATTGQFKYIALIYAQNLLQTAVCGAALISPQHMLTAAHCVYMRPFVRAFLGILNSHTRENGTEVRVSQVVIHPQYDNRRLRNDIAVLRLATNVTNSALIQPIMLPAYSQAGRNTYDNVFAVTSGWGVTNNTQSGLNPTLQFSRLHVATRAYCSEVLRNFNFSDGELCTDRTINSGPCRGDSGGPLAYYGRNGTETPVVIGLTSWGVGPCNNSNPVVYTYVGYHLKFIGNVTGLTIRN